mmetsp:Transcript_2115/g.4967  ORF Transcript_2115/g.4967 Transcript_2115/m.4967 type:complete len:407 (+) Transcript_2115:189-1409(+)
MEIVRRDEQWADAFSHNMAKKVSTYVLRDIERSAILNKRTATIGWFDHDELRLGNLLGTGDFANVHEIEGFHLRKERKGEEYSEQETEQRKEMVEATQKKVKGKAPFVVKCLRPCKLTTDPDSFVDAAYGLVMEAHILAALQHPHILPMRGLANEGSMAFRHGQDHFFIILDRLQTTLDLRIQEWSKQMAQYKTAVIKKAGQSGMPDLLFSGRLRVARDVSSALAYLHANGIIYRDLKPSNIGFDMEGTVKLFDFGLARELPAHRDDGEEFQMSSRVGTPRYMSPEVFLGERYNEKADVYSFSLVVWEMFALAKPFEEMSVVQFQKSVLLGEKRPELDSSWPEGIKVAIEESWVADPQQRPSMSSVNRSVDAELQSIRRSSLPKKVGRNVSDGLHRSNSLLEKQRH